MACHNRHHRGRVAGLYRYNPAPSEPDLRLTTHPAQASHNYLLFQNVFADDSTDVRVVGCRNCHHHPAILAFYDEDVIPHHLIEIPHI
ncbi:hypothetical protein BMF77_01317 [Dolichospermum sp. UHCC 0315A]|nr:hypothetical protein BMF77_01317 [Dolichospermum sp. UHCC 0315A]